MNNPILQAKMYLSKISFFLGNKPRLLFYPKKDVHKFIPRARRAVVIISCDFELAWAWRFAKEINYDLRKAEGIALRERKNMPFILGLCEQFNIPITWAIVGHLFLEACERKNGITHPDIKRLKHFENQYWNFSSGDWFDADPCCNWPDALEWYAPDVIKKIINSKVKHEIACHTFSHINCQQEVCPDGVFENEIQKCKDMAKDHGTVLNSFVFPANLTGHTEILKKEGFSAYRVDKDVFGFPEKDINGLWQIPTTAMICPSSHHGLSLNYHIKKYKRIIERAIRYQRVCHLWFHPSASKEFLEPVLTDLFKFIDSFRNELHITTMGAYADYLENAKL